jgi:hypothetical protein
MSDNFADRSVRNTRVREATGSSGRPRGSHGGAGSHADPRASALEAHISLRSDGGLGRHRDRTRLHVRATRERHPDYDARRLHFLDEHTASDGFIPTTKPNLHACAGARCLLAGLRDICRRDSRGLFWRVLPPAWHGARSARDSWRRASWGGSGRLLAVLQSAVAETRHVRLRHRLLLQPGGLESQLSACEPVPEPPQDSGVHSWSEGLHAARAPGEVVVGAGIVAPGAEELIPRLVAQPLHVRLRLLALLVAQMVGLEDQEPGPPLGGST